MTDLNSNQIKLYRMVRHFWQKGGAGQANELYLLGTPDAPIGWISGGGIPHNGSVDPVWSPNPAYPGQYLLRGRQKAPPELPQWDIQTQEYRSSIASVLGDLPCPITFYEVSGECESLADPDRGWEGYVLVRADGIAQTTDAGTRGSGDTDTPLMDSTPFVGSRAYPVGSLVFGDEAAAVVVQEVIDGVYLPQQTCGDCGLVNDGTRFCYTVTRANVGSPSAAGQVVYTLDGWATNATNSITGIGVANAPNAIDIVGNRLFVLVSAGSQIFYTTINRDTGAPGTWAAVAAGAAYNDAFVRSAREVWLAGNAGVIGMTRDIAIAPTQIDTGAGAVVLNRIHGSGNTIVAVGASGMIRASKNSGNSWATITLAVTIAGVLTTVTASLTGIACITEKRWWVVSAAGNAYVTENGGATWTLVPFTDSGTGACRDIVFTTPEVGYILHDASSTAWVQCTFNGGRTWARDGARVNNWPTFERGNRAVVPTANGPDTKSNTLVITGLYGVGGDGVIELGVAPRS